MLRCKSRLTRRIYFPRCLEYKALSFSLPMEIWKCSPPSQTFVSSSQPPSLWQAGAPAGYAGWVAGRCGYKAGHFCCHMQSKKVKEPVATVATCMRRWTADPGVANALIVGLACLSPKASSCCATNRKHKSSTYRIADGDLLSSRNVFSLLPCSLQWQHTDREKATVGKRTVHANTCMYHTFGPGLDTCPLVLVVSVGSATLTHRLLPTQSIPSELPVWPVCSQGMLPNLYSIQNGRLHGVCEWTQNLTRPNLTCVASHPVHAYADARQTYLRLCDTAKGSGT